MKETEKNSSKALFGQDKVLTFIILGTVAITVLAILAAIAEIIPGIWAIGITLATGLLMIISINISLIRDGMPITNAVLGTLAFFGGPLVLWALARLWISFIWE